MAALLILLTLTFNFYSAEVVENDTVIERAEFSSLSFEYRGVEEGTDITYHQTPAYLFGLTLLNFILATSTIFLFKRRQLQVKLTHLSVLLIGAKLLLVFLYYIDKAEEMMQGNIDEMGYGVSLYLLLVSILLFILARRAIIADEKLVKSSERIR